ncbi:MAG: phosphocholine cytidylyltransferase family protein [Candidatus Bathyarchaeota archaeon]
MKAIILAAGVGKRLYPLTRKMPKCMLKINKETLIEQYFYSFSKCGINEVVLVVGHLNRIIKETLDKKFKGVKIKYIYNKYYEVYGSAYSFWLTRKEFIESPIILLDSDVLFHPKILEKLVKSKHENCLIVDRSFVDTGEEVKVSVEGKTVKKLGKETVRSSNCVGENVGFYKFSENKYTVIREIMKFIKDYAFNFEYEDAINLSLDKLKMQYIPTKGLPWIEIDSPEDLHRAREDIYPKIIKHL